MRVLFREGGGPRGKGGGREKSRMQKRSRLEPKWQQAQDLEALKSESLVLKLQTYFGRFMINPPPNPGTEIGEGEPKLLWPQF